MTQKSGHRLNLLRQVDPTFAGVLARAQYEPSGSSSWVAQFDGYSPIVGSSRLAVEGSCRAQGLDPDRVVRWGREP